MRKVFPFAFLVLAAIGEIRALAGAPQIEKKWDFQGEKGIVEIRMTSFVNEKGVNYASLEVYSPDGSLRSTGEEANFLAAVLDDIPKMGVKLQSLGWISFRSNEPDAIAKVASSAAASSKWRPAVRSGNVQSVYGLVTTFLNDSNAYKDWDRVFRLHGLTLKAEGVEKVIMQPFSRTEAKCPPQVSCAHLIVPVDALVQMNIYPISKP